MMDTEIGRLEQFVRDHGGNPVAAAPSELLLPDGARVLLNGPMFRDPPADSLRRCELRLRYAKARLQQAATAEKHFHAVAAHGGGAWAWDEKALGEAPPEWRRVVNAARKDWDAENALKQRLHEIVVERRQAVAAAEAQLSQIAVPLPI